jgi:hypothetical protein
MNKVSTVLPDNLNKKNIRHLYINIMETQPLDLLEKSLEIIRRKKKEIDDLKSELQRTKRQLTETQISVDNQEHLNTKIINLEDLITKFNSEKKRCPSILLKKYDLDIDPKKKIDELRDLYSSIQKIDREQNKGELRMATLEKEKSKLGLLINEFEFNRMVIYDVANYECDAIGKLF